MSMRVEVMTDDNHLFEIEIESVLEVPQKGASITCGKCGEKRKIVKVGTPYRHDRVDVPDSDSQGKIKGV